MDASVQELLTILVTIGGLAVAYGKAMGSYQTELSQALIDAFAVRSRYRRVANLAVGVGLATGFTIVGSLWLGTWQIVPAGVLAGILSSVEAGRAHDEAKAAETPSAPAVRLTRPDPRRPA